MFILCDMWVYMMSTKKCAFLTLKHIPPESRNRTVWLSLPFYYAVTSFNEHPLLWWGLHLNMIVWPTGTTGFPQIQAFKKQHLEVCNDNWVCNKLRIRDLIISNSDDGAAGVPADSPSNITGGSEKKKQTRNVPNKRSITYILESSSDSES